MIQYMVLKNEAQANADLYNALFARLKEAGISAGLKSSNIRLVDQARVLDRPTRPSRLLNIAIGLVLGILGGVVLAFLKERLDNTIRTPEDIKELTGLSSLAMFPLIAGANGDGRRIPGAGRFGKLLPAAASKTEAEEAQPDRRFFMAKPRSAEAEAVRTLHTSIMLSRPGKPSRVILVVSPSVGEGKTTVAVNLAAVLAEHGRTCLIDADLRRPMTARTFRVASHQGLSNVLTGSVPLEKVLVPLEAVTNLLLLPVGPIPPNPGELVASEQMQEIVRRLREQFDYVVIDSPPVIPFADARALSPLTDGVVVVGRFGVTTRQAILRTREILAEAHAPILGVVLNGVDVTSPDYHYYHYGYSYSHKKGYGYPDEGGDQGEEDIL